MHLSITFNHFTTSVCGTTSDCTGCMELINTFEIKPVWLKSVTKSLSYKQKQFKGLQKHFTGNLAKKGEKIEI